MTVVRDGQVERGTAAACFKVGAGMAVREARVLRHLLPNELGAPRHGAKECIVRPCAILG